MRQLLDYLKTVPEPDEIAYWRKDLAKMFDTAPWPKGKFLSYEKLFQQFSLEAIYENPEENLPPLRQSKEQEPKNTAVFYNGAPILAESVTDGLEILSYYEAVERYPYLIESHLKKQRSTRTLDKLDIIARSGFTDGIVIYLHDNMFSKETQEANTIYLYESIGKDALIASTFVLVLVGKNNYVRIVSERLPISFDGESIGIQHEDIFVDEGASCTYIAFGRQSENVREIVSKDFYIGNESNVQYHDLVFGSKTMRQKIFAYLEGSSSQFHHQGMTFANQDQIFETITLINNIGKGTEGKVLYKNLVNGKGKAYFEGLIKVEKGADFTNSYLEDHTILLSNEAVSESIPGLEIEAKEVKASHGATVGAIDADQLFYAQSRGMTTQEATKLIALGFLRPILTALQDPSLETRILAYFNQKLS